MMDAEQQVTFGMKVCEYRMLLGMSQDDLANKISILSKGEYDSKQGIAFLENGERGHPHPRNFKFLADALGLDDKQRMALRALPRVLPQRVLPPEVEHQEVSLDAMRAFLRLLRIQGLPGDNEGRAADLAACTFMPMRLAIGILEAVRDFHGDRTLNGAWVNVTLSLGYREPYCKEPRPPYAEQFGLYALDAAQRVLTYLGESDDSDRNNYLLRALALDRRAMAYHLLKDYSSAGNSYKQGARILSVHPDDPDARTLAAWIALNHLLLRIDGEQPYESGEPGADARGAAILLTCRETFVGGNNLKAQWHVVIGAVALAASRATRLDRPHEHEAALRWYMHLPDGDGTQSVGATYFRLLDRYSLINNHYPDSQADRSMDLQGILTEVQAWLETLVADTEDDESGGETGARKWK